MFSFFLLINLFTMPFAAVGIHVTCRLGVQKRNLYCAIQGLEEARGLFRMHTESSPCYATAEPAVVLARRQGPPFLATGFAAYSSYSSLLQSTTSPPLSHSKKANFRGA